MSLLTAAVGFGPEQPLKDLLDLKPDPFFPEKEQGTASKKLSFLKVSDPNATTPSTQREDLIVEQLTKLNLDLTRISDRILVMGRCWMYRTDREACRNNIEEVACFLNARYEKNYLVFNFSSPDLRYDLAPFRNQVISYPTSKLLMISVRTLFAACRAMSSWLRLHPQNVVVVQCKNGKSRSGLVVACLLRYCGYFDTAQEAFDYFRSKRSSTDQSWVTVTLRRYLRYFNDILTLDGKVPSVVPLQLHQVILTTVPDFDGRGGCDPGIEVYQEGRLVYSSAIRKAELSLESSKNGAASDAENEGMDEELLRELKISMVLNPDKFDKDFNPLVMMDSYNIIFRLDNMCLDGDVQVRVYHHNAQAGHNVTIFNLAFNTGFMAPGIVRLRMSDLEIPSSDTKRFDSEFAVDLVMAPDESGRAVISYESSSHRSFARDLMKLSHCHPVRADPLMAKPLELQGHRKFFVKLALQLGNNDIHSAHEFLATLSRSPLYTGLDRELTELTRSKYESMQPKVTIPETTESMAQDKKIEVTEKKIEETVSSTEKESETPKRPSGPAFLAGLAKATEGRRNVEILPDTKESEEKEESNEKASRSGPPFLVGLMKAAAGRKNLGVLEKEEDEPPMVPSSGPPFLAGLLKATAGRKNQGSLEDSGKEGESSAEPSKESESPKGPSGGPPFLAGLLKATANRRNAGSLESSQESIDEEKPKSPTGGPPFLAGLMKATANRRNQGTLSTEDEPAQEPEEAPKPSGHLAPINPNPPPAPPLPNYLCYPKPSSSLQSSPSSMLASGNIELSIADDLSRASTPPPFGALPPPPPPFPGKKAPAIPENRQKIKNTLHWGEIRNEERIRNTIWSELQETGDTKEKILDVHKFEELFCVNPSEEASRSLKKSEHVEEVKNAPRLLDSRRANNVGIGLSRFYKRMTNADMINAIVFQKHLLDTNDLVCLKAIIPTDDERQQLALFSGDSKFLVPSEQFMLDMLRVPNLEWMIDALIFEHQLPVECESLSGRLSAMTAILIKIRESPTLKTLFRLVLELGNLANYDYGRVPAHMRVRGKALGFTMDSLLKLHEVKSVDRKSSLLNYLLMVVEERNPELLSLPEDFSELSTVKHWDSNALFGDLEALKSSLSRISNLKNTKEGPDSALVDAFRESQAPFIALAKTKLERLSKQAESLKIGWTECAGYLGEDPDDKRPEELMIVFDQFFRHFKEAHEQNIKTAKASKATSNVSLRIRSSNSASSLRSEIATSRSSSPMSQSDSLVNTDIPNT